jgi:hypothetical protein
MSKCELCGDQYAEYTPYLAEYWVILDPGRRWKFRGCEDCWRLIASRVVEAMRHFDSHREAVYG